MPGAPPQPRRPRIERLWRGDLTLAQRILWTPTVPAAALYCLALGARGLFWRQMRRRARPRVVSVGNLTVGGNSKTPFTLYLANRLLATGLRVAIVSRGYTPRARPIRALLVSDGVRTLADPAQVGDEAVMMAKSFAGPIVVARRRIDGIELLESTVGPLDVVVLDDGFQHVRLARDLDLLLINADRGIGNRWLLPAGPMREPAHAAIRADAVIVIGSAPHAGDAPLTAVPMPPARANQPMMRAVVRPRALVSASQAGWVESPPSMLGRRVLAVSGLADASGFYAMLHELEANLVDVLEYPDHHAYSASDWHNIVAAARSTDIIVTTEKDLVKLERFPFERDSLYALRLEVAMAPEDEQRLLAMAGAAPSWVAESAPRKIDQG